MVEEYELRSRAMEIGRPTADQYAAGCRARR
jgi:hypothetical protein